MESQVQVTLTALNGDIYPAERVLKLVPGCHAVTIGRASKSINKGIVGAHDNAWFDSPVMSRSHAELWLNGEDNTVEVQDLGSMHGTFLNNAGLAKHEPAVVYDNDIVVFGACVTRGAESIPACAFRITLEYSPYKKYETLTFACPDTSDIDEGFEISDDEGAEQPSSDDGVSIESPQSKAPPLSNTIDLTEDEEPTMSPVNRDITTSNLSSAKNNEDILIDLDAPLDDDASLAIVLDSDDEDDIGPSNFDNHSDESDSDDRSSYYEHSLDGLSPGVQDAEPSYHPTLCAPEPSHHSSDQPLLRDHLAFDIDETSCRVRIAESIMSEDGSESDLDLSDDGVENNIEGFRLLCEAAVDKTCDSNDELSKSPTCTCEATEEALGAPLSVEYATVPSADELPSIVRQPSPSDAAMAKSLAKPVAAHHNPNNDLEQISTRSLLEDVRKRAIVETRNSYDVVFSAPPTTAGTASPDLTKSQKSEIDTSRLTIPPMHGNESQAPDPTVDKSHSPLLDMTSGVRYNESKLVMTGAIRDEIPQHSRPKRKADEISDVIKRETESGTPGQRSKRLKKVVEGAAYIALGGVGVFTVLVATAPNY